MGNLNIYMEQEVILLICPMCEDKYEQPCKTIRALHGDQITYLRFLECFHTIFKQTMIDEVISMNHPEETSILEPKT